MRSSGSSQAASIGLSVRNLKAHSPTSTDGTPSVMNSHCHPLSLPTSFLTGTAAAGGIALINSIGNLGGFVGPYAIGWIKDATGETTLGLVLLAACSIIAGVVTFLMGHDSKIEMAGSHIMAE